MEAEITKPSGIDSLVAWMLHNTKQVVIGVGAIVVVCGGVGIYSWSKDQGEIKANEQLFIAPSLGTAKSTASADNYAKVAEANASSNVGERAEILVANVLFAQNKFAEAQ